MSILWIILLILSFLVGLVLFLSYRDKKHFQSRGIPYFGNGLYRIIHAMFTGITFSDNAAMQYKEMKARNLKFAGVTDFGQSSILICDLDILKNILVKDFEHFADRRLLAMPKKDFLLSKMLMSLKGEPWKVLRSKMSPTFTTGKIKRMFKILNASGKKLVTFLETQMDKSGQVDLAVGYSKYAMDVIASVACGLDSKAFAEETSNFEAMGRKLQFEFGGLKLLNILVIALFPKFSDMLGLSFLDKVTQDFFTGAIKASIRYRQEKGEVRDDFIQLIQLLEARAGHLKLEENELENFEKDAVIKTSEEKSKINTAELLDDEGIVANALLFILAGFDTTQSLLLFLPYVLAIHTTVQDKLRIEIDTILEECDGEFTYDGLSKMTYLDSVINETLRCYPPAAITDRNCTKDYKVPGTEFILKKGEAVVIPIIGIHRDEQYYAEPNKFDPERFSPENKHKLNPYAFLPFGHGPRNCIGMRFALAEVKLAVAHLISNFTIEPSEKTLIPMQYQNTGSLKPLGGMWVALKKRF